jgi:hypothetical protein
LINLPGIEAFIIVRQVRPQALFNLGGEFDSGSFLEMKKQPIFKVWVAERKMKISLLTGSFLEFVQLIILPVILVNDQPGFVGFFPVLPS